MHTHPFILKYSIDLPFIHLSLSIRSIHLSTANQAPVTTADGYIECPEANCRKRYKHMNGLKYHRKTMHPVVKQDDDSDKVHSCHVFSFYILSSSSLPQLLYPFPFFLFFLPHLFFPSLIFPFPFFLSSLLSLSSSISFFTPSFLFQYCSSFPRVHVSHLYMP